MAKEIKIPQISEGVETATVTEILVSEGDDIKKDQSIIAVESDKASVEIPSPQGGKVKSIKVSEGDEVNVEDVILTLEESNADEQESKDSGSDEEGEKEESDEKSTQSDDSENESEEEGEGDEKEEESKKTSTPKNSSERASIPAAPGVRRFARELGVDLSKVEGSGEKGRISKSDIKAYEKGGKPSEISQTDLPDFSQWGKIERKKLSGMRKTTAQKVSGAWQNIPHVFQFDEADITEIEDYMAKNQDQIEKEGAKLTITAVLTKLVADGLKKFPKFNASIDFENEEMILKSYINIGIAVDTEKGLLLPVIKEVDKKGIVDLAVEISELAEKARNQKLTAKEMEGGNFSISNLGGIGGTNFTPIIYHPQVAILGVSRAQVRPVYKEGNFEPRKILPLSLSYDHRLIDGAEAARFITWLKNALENPFEALLS